ncbi:MAG: ferredoxin family protein [Verrucomicrobiota bacterium]
MLIKTESQPFLVLLYEGAGAISVNNDTRFALTSSLLDHGYSVTRTASNPDLALLPDTDRILVLGNFQGNAPALEDNEGKVDIATHDMHGLDTAAILAAVESFRNERPLNQPASAVGNGGPLSPNTSKTWKPWFPVIDYDRCTNCMQCLSFCLFDVYGVDDDQRIQVQNNDNCKTNCPACSRVCPEVAIMFPKYGSGPINGAPVSESDVNREKMKVDITSLLGGDIYASLRERSEAAKSRFSKERSPDKALNERKKCLTKLQQDGFIPPEVLASIDLTELPSPEEIMRKAEAAAAHANGNGASQPIVTPNKQDSQETPTTASAK